MPPPATPSQAALPFSVAAMGASRQQSREGAATAGGPDIVVSHACEEWGDGWISRICRLGSREQSREMANRDSVRRKFGVGGRGTAVTQAARGFAEPVGPDAAGGGPGRHHHGADSATRGAAQTDE